MQKLSRVHKRHTPSERSDILESYRRSRLTQEEFCRQQQIGKSTLQLWLRKAEPVRQPHRSAGFVSVPNLLSSVSHTPSAADYRLRFPSGVVLEIGSGFNTDEAARLLELVQRL